MNPDTFIKKAVEKIKININPEKIILFGSYAYGHPDISSDIDFFILLNSYEKPVKRRIKVSKLFLNREYPLDFIVYNREELSDKLEENDEFIMEIINLIQNMISLVNLIQNLIDSFSTLFQLIQDLIELIRSIFNPSHIAN